MSGHLPQPNAVQSHRPGIICASYPDSNVRHGPVLDWVIGYCCANSSHANESVLSGREEGDRR